ncbi:MAG TPA: hypothetical protein VGG34_03400 [Opitutaceae bacterium]|jgi:hypothetical protein
MFADLVRLINGRPSDDYERSFVREVRVTTRSPRDPKTERLILICWAIIVVKSFLVIWIFDRYHVPFNALWVIAPTVIFAALVTVVYMLRD